MTLTADAIHAALAKSLHEWLPRQDSASGAYIGPESGLDDPSHSGTGLFLAACTLCVPGQPELLPRAVAAVDYLLRYQRPSGLIDLRSCNFDSSPDTAFVVQLLCETLRQCRPTPELAGKLEQFIRRAAPGIAAGGFHTPNHRWVIASALAQTQALFPDLVLRPTIERYLNEGFDVDAEGCFIEHSSAIYDAVTDRALLFLDEYLHLPAARVAALANLDFNLHLLHSDGTIETGLSRRQDAGTRVVPLSLAACYAQASLGNVAAWLWERATDPRLSDLVWLAFSVGKSQPTGQVPDNFSRYFSGNGLWRLRRGSLSASVFRNATRLLTLCHGATELSAVKISQSYFGTGRFMADALTVAGTTVTLRSEGQRFPRRPGYDFPTGLPVPPAQWAEISREREWRALPPCTSELTIHELPDGLALTYRTLAGMDRVPAQMAFDFPPGGEWESDAGVIRPQAGDVLFLKSGHGTMRYGANSIRIGPGAHAHHITQMRDTEPAPQHVRVLLTFVTPVMHELVIQFR